LFNFIRIYIDFYATEKSRNGIFFTCVHWVSVANYYRYENRNFIKTVYTMKYPTVYENSLFLDVSRYNLAPYGIRKFITLLTRVRN
jgi:hypothetical protein